MEGLRYYRVQVHVVLERVQVEVYGGILFHYSTVDRMNVIT